MKKLCLGILILAVGAVAAAALVTPKPPQEEPVAEARAVLTVTATTVERRALQRILTATGSIHPWQELELAPQLGGYRVAAVEVDIGTPVRRGQELARLDDELLAAETRARRAALTRAQALAQRSAADHRRGEALAERQLLSPADLERLQSDLAAAQADVQLARANLEIAESNLRHTRITAPADGVISSRSVNLGEIAQVGRPMFQLLRDGRLEWRAEMPESRLPLIRAGQPVQLRTADGGMLQGTVRTIDPHVDADSRNALVYVDLPVPGGARPGMFARGEFLLDDAAANTIPLASVVRSDGYSYVLAVGDDRIVRRLPIETGAIDGDRVEVVSGLDTGQRIVHSGAAFLKDGDRVEVVTEAATVAAGDPT
jgi:RND family efflux transporter MFP subunit